jgi:hypothetical protein
MICNVCGLEYGLSHNCPGPLSAAGQDILSARLQAPMSAGIGYYLGEALKIVRWDDLAVRRNAKDPGATFYAIFFWIVSMLIVVLYTSLTTLSRVLPKNNPVALLIGASIG